MKRVNSRLLLTATFLAVSCGDAEHKSFRSQRSNNVENLEGGTAELELTSTSLRQNLRNRFDVNDDGRVTETDVNYVVSAYNGLISASNLYVDVNGDRTLAADDILLVSTQLKQLKAACSPTILNIRSLVANEDQLVNSAEAKNAGPLSYLAMFDYIRKDSPVSRFHVLNDWYSHMNGPVTFSVPRVVNTIKAQSPIGNGPTINNSNFQLVSIVNRMDLNDEIPKKSPQLRFIYKLANSQVYFIFEFDILPDVAGRYDQFALEMTHMSTIPIADLPREMAKLATRFLSDKTKSRLSTVRLSFLDAYGGGAVFFRQYNWINNSLRMVKLPNAMDHAQWQPGNAEVGRWVAADFSSIRNSTHNIPEGLTGFWARAGNIYDPMVNGKKMSAHDIGAKNSINNASCSGCHASIRTLPGTLSGFHLGLGGQTSSFVSSELPKRKESLRKRTCDAMFR